MQALSKLAQPETEGEPAKGEKRSPDAAAAAAGIRKEAMACCLQVGAGRFWQGWRSAYWSVRSWMLPLFTPVALWCGMSGMTKKFTAPDTAQDFWLHSSRKSSNHRACKLHTLLFDSS